jgi:hypothetical protein
MNRITALLAGLAAFTVISTAAEAAQGCGKGWHYNGQRCVPKGSAEHRQPYHRATGSSGGLGEQDEEQSRAALHAARHASGDHHRPSRGRSVSSGGLGEQDEEQSRAALHAARQASGDHHRPSRGRSVSSGGLGEQDEEQSRAALHAARQAFGDHHRPSRGRRVSSADLGDRDYRPHHRHKGVSVDLGSNMRLHFHQGGISFHHGGTD